MVKPQAFYKKSRLGLGVGSLPGVSPGDADPGCGLVPWVTKSLGAVLVLPNPGWFNLRCNGEFKPAKARPGNNNNRNNNSRSNDDNGRDKTTITILLHSNRRLPLLRNNDPGFLSSRKDKTCRYGPAEKCSSLMLEREKHVEINGRDIVWPWRPPDGSTSANPLVRGHGIKQRCDPAVITRRTAVLPQQDVCYLAAAGVWETVPACLDTRLQSVFFSEEEWLINGVHINKHLNVRLLMWSD